MILTKSFLENELKKKNKFNNFSLLLENRKFIVIHIFIVKNL